jgi:transcriptional regulator with XRE-family HTH domain
MVSAESLWKDNLQRLGEFIKAQRHINQLSQRELARLSDLSDTYMSQLERGLHEPSIRVLRALADSLGVQPSQLINYAAGLPVDRDADRAAVRTEDAIRNDPRFTEAQKKALLGVVRSYVEANEPSDAVRRR